MAISLHAVAPQKGLAWVRQAFVVFFRRPLAFTVLFALFLFGGTLVAGLIPHAGRLIALMAVPLLSLGFMIATRSALQDKAVHPGQLVQALRGDPARRRSLLVLCVAYGLMTLLIMTIWGWVDGGRFDRWQELMSSRDAKPEEIDALVSDDRLIGGILVFLGLGGLLSIPFWHAPALVYWGGQGAAQALFSSTLALWRTRAAFFVYMVAWSAVVMLFGLLAATVFGLLGLRAMIPVAALPAGLMFSTAFYVSLYFVFVDTFGAPGNGAEAPAER
jgi:hypothetical protein